MRMRVLVKARLQSTTEIGCLVFIIVQFQRNVRRFFVVCVEAKRLKRNSNWNFTFYLHRQSAFYSAARLCVLLLKLLLFVEFP